MDKTNLGKLSFGKFVVFGPLPEDTHALFGVPVVEELQAGNGEKLENK